MKLRASWFECRIICYNQTSRTLNMELQTINTDRPRPLAFRALRPTLLGEVQGKARARARHRLAPAYRLVWLSRRQMRAPTARGWRRRAELPPRAGRAPRRPQPARLLSLCGPWKTLTRVTSPMTFPQGQEVPRTNPLSVLHRIQGQSISRVASEVYTVSVTTIWSK